MYQPVHIFPLKTINFLNMYMDIVRWFIQSSLYWTKLLSSEFGCKTLTLLDIFVVGTWNTLAIIFLLFNNYCTLVTKKSLLYYYINKTNYLHENSNFLPEVGRYMNSVSFSLLNWFENWNFLCSHFVFLSILFEVWKLTH
jgi:hypothetical protein